MNLDTKTTGIDMRVLFSTLWLFLLLNIIFRDIHELVTAEALQEIMTGVVNGTPVTEGLLLLGAFIVEVPIVMVLLSRVLRYRVNRWANIIAGAATLMIVVTSALTDLDDGFFIIVESVTLLVIIWLAWRWPNPELSLNDGI